MPVGPRQVGNEAAEPGEPLRLGIEVGIAGGDQNPLARLHDRDRLAELGEILAMAVPGEGDRSDARGQEQSPRRQSRGPAWPVASSLKPAKSKSPIISGKRGSMNEPPLVANGAAA